MNRITFDIETRPHPDALAIHEPLFTPAEIPDYKPDSRLKDPEKVAANFAEVARKNLGRVAEQKADVDAQREKWLSDGALRAERGQVLAIGYKLKGEVGIFEGNERAILIEFLNVLAHAAKLSATVSGFNILNFDLPFIRRRCIILGIPFPFYNRTDKWKPWAFPVYDAMVDWQCGNYRDGFVSLDAVARALGVGKKTGSGKDFSALYESDREAALSYLRNDVNLTDEVCGRLLQ